MTAIEIDGLSKRFGEVVAVDDLSFSARPGAVTGFLGPNGAGKSTTLRALLGLVHPTAGAAVIAGRHYGELREPFRHVGAVLEADAFHPGPRARDHLRVLATAARLPLERVGAVLREVDLADAGAIRTSATDLLRFLAASLAPPDEPPGPALARAAEPRFTINKRLALGLGWMVLRRKDRPVTIWHSGGTWGFRSFAAMSRSAGPASLY